MKSQGFNTDLPELGGACGAPGPARRGWLAMLALALTALLASALLSAVEPVVELEYKVKAGYLFNFARFVEWPGEAIPTATSPIIIGVLAGNEVLPIIQQVLEGKTVNDHPLVVKSIKAARPDSGCHILFVSRTVSQSPSEVHEALGSSSATLLVGETDNFAEKGGMIGFVREDETFRLRLNLEAATRAGLKVSAKMSSVAQVVKTKRDK